MFSTIFDKAASYFDRRWLVSAFFPCLVFWGITALAFIIFQMDSASALNTWDKLSITMQFILLLAFFVWVTFWSFLTNNFRVNYTRVFEGYWSEDVLPSAYWSQKGKIGWRNRWDELNTQRRKLESQITDLEQELLLCEELVGTSEVQQRVSVGTALGDSAQQGQALDQLLPQWEERLKALSRRAEKDTVRLWFPLRRKEHLSALLQAEDMFNKELQQWSQEWRGKWEQGNDAVWHKCEGKLKVLGRQFAGLLKQRITELETRSSIVSREMSLFYPPDHSKIMPTRLGNVLRAIEFYSLERYNLDAVVIWPRLQQDLPEGFSSSLLDSKASLDLMVTLSTFILLFGIPLSIWGAVIATSLSPWWVSSILVLAALSLRLSYAAGVAGLTLIASLFLPPHVSPVIQLHTLVVALIGTLLLFRLTYQNTIAAAIDYGEKIKAAFDLYRWKVLENLHLRLPRNFGEEHQIWDQVCQLLYYGVPPDPDSFHYVLPEQGKETTISSAKTKEVPPTTKTEEK